MRTTALLIASLVLGCGSRRDDAGPKPTTPATADGSQSAGSGSGSAHAEPPLPTATDTHVLADKVCPSVTGAYFFKVEKDGKTSHILGTRHLGVDIAKLPHEVTDALTSAALAVFETSPSDRSDRDLPAVEHKPLPDELGAELWHHYEGLIGDALAARLVDQDPPTALLMMIALYEDKSSALDDQLQQLAEAKAIPIQGLETSAFQDKLIRRWLDMRALKAAIKVTDDRAELEQTTIDDLGDYCAGTDNDPGPDPKERKDMIDGGYTDAEIDQYTEELVFSRNRDWIPKLDKLFAKGNVFIAVGADHLSGDQGVVTLLGKHGYTVTRVFSPARAP